MVYYLGFSYVLDQEKGLILDIALPIGIYFAIMQKKDRKIGEWIINFSILVLKNICASFKFLKI